MTRQDVLAHGLQAALSIAGLLLVASCASKPATLAQAAPLPVVSGPVCIPVRRYTPEEQLALARAIVAEPPTSPLVPAMLDYDRMRKAARAACPAG